MAELQSSDYKGNVVGVFIRLVILRLLRHHPAEVASMDVFLSPKVQLEEGERSLDGDSESGEAWTDPVTGVSYLNWMRRWPTKLIRMGASVSWCG
jgi:hypothetical protein